MQKISFMLAVIFCAAGSHAQYISSKIVFSHFNKVLQTDSIFAMDNNGQSLSGITTGFYPIVSPSGKYMAFSNGPNLNSGYGANLWIRDLVAQHDTLIVYNGDWLNLYAFFPSEQKLVYSQSCAIYTTNSDGTNAYSYLGCNPCDCFSDNPSLRVKDSLITYHNVHYGIYTIKPDGDSSVKVPHTYPGDLFPVWSVEGDWIAYEKTVPGLSYVVNNIYKIRPDGSDSTQLTFFSSSDTLTANVTWSADQQTIYFIGRVNGTLGFYRVMADGSGDYVLLKEWTGGGSINDFFLGQADSIASFPTGTQPTATSIAYWSVYPNPASDEITFSVSTTRTSLATLEILDVTGRKVKTVWNGMLDSGQRIFHSGEQDLSPGIYVARLNAGGTVYQKKLVVQH